MPDSNDGLLRGRLKWKLNSKETRNWIWKLNLLLGDQGLELNF